MATPSNIPPIRKDGIPKWLYETLRRLGDRTTDSSRQLYASTRGEAPFSGGQVADDSRYVLLGGRTGGQKIKGTPSGVTCSLNLTSSLATFEFSSLVMRAAGMSDQPLLVGAAIGPGPGFQNYVSFDVQSGHITINGAAEAVGSQNVFFVSHGNSALTTVTAVFQKRASQSANLVEFRSGSSPMSYIRATDGAFVGIVVPTGLEHSLLTDETPFTVANTITNGTTLLTSTFGFGSVQAGHAIFGSGIPAGTTVSVVTDASNLTMSAAATDSTTATRTFASDDHGQYLLLYGRTSGHHIGSSPQPGGTRNPDDISMSGRLNIGTSNFAADCLLQLQKAVSTGSSSPSSVVRFTRIFPSITASGNVSTTYEAIEVSLTGGAQITSGNPSFTAIKYIANPSGTSAYVIGTITGEECTAQLSGTNSSAANLLAINGKISGNTVYPGVTDITGIASCIRFTFDPAKSNIAALNGIEFRTNSATVFGVMAQARGINLDGMFNTGTFTGTVFTCTVSNGSNVITGISPSGIVPGMLAVAQGTGAFPAGTTVVSIDAGLGTVTVSANATASGSNCSFNGAITQYSGIYVASDRPGNCITVRILDIQSDDDSQHYGRFYFRPPSPASYPVPTAYVHIGAGAAAASSAPIKLTSGTSLTTPEAGAIEFTTDDLYFTITTGAARKGIILNDGTNLTSGRVPFVTTNGRLKDDASFLFAIGTGLTLSAINLITDTTTGMKIGTSTAQKLGFWNTAPIVQPTTAVAAATFVANTSGIADDSATFDGYTIGQVVKALRNEGLLA